ncbi:MAG: ABC transporter permease [Verrucomicrobia bacterium]|nr:ABC transporter permease [Verrucomicrobiota bacterium]
MKESSARMAPSPGLQAIRRAVRWPGGLEYAGRQSLRFLETLHGLLSFAFISLGVLLVKWNTARAVVRPLIVTHVHRAGLELLPMVVVVAVVLGLVVIGQTVALMSQVGANALLGTIMVTVVVRELGPLLSALVVLARSGMTHVIELGTARALGEIEALEVMGIDPIHYMVVPRILGMALGILALSVYFILVSLGSGYLWAFLQDVPLTPGDYLRQLGEALDGLDFFLLALKTCAFGFIIALVSCYHGLARPLRLEEVPRIAIRATVHSVIGCVLLDGLLILCYLAL